jgi:hypothetical protein
MKILYVYLLAAAGTAFAQDSRNTGWVVIPVNEYGALRARAYPVERAPDTPPVEATLTRVDYELRVAGEIASGRATLTVDVLKDGWVRVPVPAGLAVREARIEGKLVSLVRGDGALSEARIEGKPGSLVRGDGVLAALLPKRGRSVLQLDIALPVTSNGGEGRLILPASPSGVTRASLTMARPDVEVKVAGGLLAERVSTESETRVVAFARGNEALAFTLRLKMEEQKRAPQTLRMRGSLAQLVTLGEDATSVSAEANIEVTQGAARTVRIAVPASVTVNTVDGANVADWEARDGTLTVAFLDPVERKASFLISGDTRLPRDGAMDLPLLRLLDSERESGGVAVEVLGAGEIKNLRSQGLERTEAGDLGATVAARQSPSLVAFRYRTGGAERSLHVEVARYTQQAVLTANIEEARYRVLITPDGKTLVEAHYAVRNNQRNFVRITLPTGAALWSASLAGRPARPGRGPDGSLLFPLEKSRAGEDAPLFAVEVLYLSAGTAWSDKGHATLVLPGLDLPVSRTGLLLYHPPRSRVTVDAGAFRVQPFAEPTSAPLTGDGIPNAPPPAAANPPLNAANSSLNAANSPATQALVDRYRARRDARRPADAVPLRVEFPAVGPSIYLASELTAENQAATVELNYQKERNGGYR